MKNILGPIVEPLQKFAAYKEELKDLEARAAAADRELAEAAAEGPLSDPKISRRISAAHATLDSVKLRTAHVTKQGKPLFEALKAALTEADREWTLAIEVSAKVIEARFIKANRKFFNGDVEAAHLALAGTPLPGTDWRNRIWYEHDAPMTEETIFTMARRFSQHVALYMNDLVEIPDDLTPANP